MASRGVSSSRSLSRRIGALVLLLAALSVTSTKSARAQSGEEGWLNQNYFDAAKTTFSTELLLNAERNHFAQGNFWSKYKAGNLGYALEDLKYVLLVFPNHPKALHMLGLICRTTKDNLTPIIYFEKAVRLFPQEAYTEAQYGAYLISIGEQSAAIARLNEALRIDPNLTFAQALLAEAQEKERASAPSASGTGPGVSTPPAASTPASQTNQKTP